MKHYPTVVLEQEWDEMLNRPSLVIEQAIHRLRYGNGGHRRLDPWLSGKTKEFPGLSHLVMCPTSGSRNALTYPSFEFGPLCARHQFHNTLTKVWLLEQSVQVDKRGRNAPQVVTDDTTTE